MKKITLTIFGLLICISGLNAQTPANDDCSGAIELFSDQFSCNNNVIQVIIDNTATPSSESDPGCNYGGGDVWYKLVIPSTGGVRIETREGSIDDNGMAIYTGSCGSLNYYGCNDDGNGVHQLMSTYEVAGVPGETIFIRLWTYNGTQTGNFDICSVDIPSPTLATNDDCINATELTTNVTCSNIVTGSNNATDSSETSPNCPEDGTYAGRDVWFKFMVPDTGAFAIETSNDDGSITDTAMSLYSGDCNTLTEIICSDDIGGGNKFSRIEESFTPNNELYIRVFSFANLELGTFNICATELPPLSTDDFDLEHFTLYPNPAKDIINLKFNQISNTNLNVNIFDIQGKLVLNKTKLTQNNSAQLDISNLKKGMYFLNIYDGERELTKKLIVK